MKKKLLVLLAILLALSVSPVVRSAYAASAQYWWIPPFAYNSGGGYYTAYDDGATASLAIAVYNDDESFGFNVSKIVLNFLYIGVNKTLDLSAAPYQITEFNAKTFYLNFTAHASEFPVTWHYYRLIIENVNSTSAPMKQLSPFFVTSGYFAVYTADQTDANNLNEEFWDYANGYPYYYFDSVEAEYTAFQAVQQGHLGDTALDHEDYAAAKTYYQAGIDMYKQAFGIEEAFRKTSEQAELNTTMTENAATMTNANANLTLAQAEMTRAQGETNAAMTNANGFGNGFLAIGIGFAIGFALIGVGAIIYAFRKPKPAT